MLGVRIKVVQVVSGALGTVLKRLRKQSWYWIPHWTHTEKTTLLWIDRISKKCQSIESRERIAWILDNIIQSNLLLPGTWGDNPGLKIVSRRSYKCKNNDNENNKNTTDSNDNGNKNIENVNDNDNDTSNDNDNCHDHESNYNRIFVDNNIQYTSCLSVCEYLQQKTDR